MTTPFGAQLIGETEKALNALLRRFLEGTGLAEPQWVTLRLADLLDGTVDACGLVDAVTARGQFPAATAIVGELTDRGLLDDGRLTPAGRTLMTQVQDVVRAETGPIWEHLPSEDVDAATRVLNEVATRARSRLA